MCEVLTDGRGIREKSVVIESEVLAWGAGGEDRLRAVSRAGSSFIVCRALGSHSPPSRAHVGLQAERRANLDWEV